VREPVHRARRRVLVAAGSTAAGAFLGGCLTGGGSEGSPGDDGSPVDDDGDQGGGEPSAGSGDGSCEAISGGYERFDVGAKPLVCDPELPSLVAGAAEFQDAYQRVFAQVIDDDVTGGGWTVTVRHQGRNLATPPGGGDAFPEEAGSFTFGGETVTVWRATEVGDGSASRRVDLPYDVDGDTLYYQTNVTVKLRYPPDSVEGSCASALEEAADHVATTLVPNPDATVGGGG
jgi:hypothetical protein